MEFLIVFTITVVLVVRAKVKSLFENNYRNERKVYKERYSPKIVIVIKREKIV